METISFVWISNLPTKCFSIGIKRKRPQEKLNSDGSKTGWFVIFPCLQKIKTGLNNESQLYFLKLFLFYYSKILKSQLLEGFLGRESGAFQQLPDVSFLRKIEFCEPSLKETTSGLSQLGLICNNTSLTKSPFLHLSFWLCGTGESNKTKRG